MSCILQSSTARKTISYPNACLFVLQKTLGLCAQVHCSSLSLDLLLLINAVDDVYVCFDLQEKRARVQMENYSTIRVPLFIE